MIKIFAVAAFVAASTNAAFIWKDDSNTAGVKYPRMAWQFPNFLSFPPLVFPPIPSPEDITKNTDPNFTGVFITSTSNGTTVVTNKGGVIKKYAVGENGDPNKSTVLAAAAK